MLRRRFISSFFRPRAGSLAYAAAPRRSPALVLSTFNHDMKRFSASSARTHETEEEEEYFEEDEPLVETEWHLVYEGAMARPLKRIKMVSLTSCTLSIISMPLLAVFGNQDVYLAGRVAVAFTAGCFGVGTTAFVHFIGKTYQVLAVHVEKEEGICINITRLSNVPLLTHALPISAASLSVARDEVMRRAS